MNKSLWRLADITLRLFSIAARALFIFYLAKHLKMQSFGLFAYMQATVALYQYVAAADFNLVAHRYYLGGHIPINGLIKSQAVALFAGILVTTFILLALMGNDLPPKLHLMMLLILALETVTSELVRLFITTSRFTIGNLINFLKTAGWMLPTITVDLFISKLDIEQIIYAWGIGLAAALLISLALLPCKLKNIIQAKAPSDLFKKAIKSLPIILVGTIALRGMFTLDRILVEHVSGLGTVGIYGFYVGCAAAYLALLDAGVIARCYPAIIGAVNSKDSHQQKKLISSVAKQSLLLGLAGAACYYLLIDWFLLFIGKTELNAYKNVGLMLIAAYTIYGISMGPHFVLYANHRDFHISAIHVMSLVPFGLMLVIQENVASLYVTAMMVLASSAIQLALKSHLSKTYLQQSFCISANNA